MPSTFSTNLGIELITTGEQAGTWGATTNTNLGTLIEQAISGYVAQVITDGADTVITIPSGSTGVARNMTLELTGALSAARNLIVPSNRKLYFIYNNTTGGYAVTVKVSGQTGVSVPNGAKVLLVSNGTDVVNAVNYIPALYFPAGTAAAPSISTIGDTNTGIYFPAADEVGVSTGGTERLRVDSSGNLGLGVTPSAWGSFRGLQVGNTALMGNTSDASGRFLNNAYYDGTDYKRISVGAANMMALGGGGGIQWYLAPSAAAGTTITTFGIGSEAMTLDTSGNLTVGNVKLETGSGFGGINTVGATPLLFYTNATERMRLDSSGNLGIGTSSPGAKLQVTTTGVPIKTTGPGAGSVLSDVYITRSSSGTAIQTGPNVTFEDGTTNNSITIQNSQGNLTFWNYAAGVWNERARITSGGDFVVGPSSSFSTLSSAGALSTKNTANSSGFDFGLLGGSTDPNAYIYQRANGYLAFGTNNTERMRLDSSGNLGLGVTPSASWPSGTTAIQFGPSSALYNPGSGSRAIFASNAIFTSGVSTATYITSNAAAYYDQDNGTHKWLTAPSGTAGNAISFTQAMTLDASGNLGLGVTPSAWSGGFKATQYPGGSVASYASGTNLQIEVGNAYYQSSLGTYAYYNTGTAPTLYRQISGEHRWLTAPSGTAGNAISFTQAMTLDASGKLGINTTSPTSMLDVSGINTGSSYESGEQVLTLRNTSTSSGARGAGIRMCFGTSNSGSAQIDLINGSTGQEGSLSFGTRNSSGSLAERMRLDSAGRLGIGTSTPTYKLTISGAAGDPQILSTDGNVRSYIAYPSGAGTSAVNFIGTDSTHAQAFITNNAERARITSDGRFCINSTTGSTDSQLFVKNSGSQTFAGTFENHFSDGWGISIGTVSTVLAHFYPNASRTGGPVGSITTNGSSTSYVTSSDLRLKDNITPAPSASDDIDAIQIVSHDWKAAPDEHVKYGVIAQDLNIVAPQAVFQGDDGEEVEKVWGVDYSKLVPMLIKEIQSLRSRVAALESN